MLCGLPVDLVMLLALNIVKCFILLPLNWIKFKLNLNPAPYIGVSGPDINSTVDISYIYTVNFHNQILFQGFIQRFRLGGCVLAAGGGQIKND